MAHREVVFHDRGVIPGPLALFLTSASADQIGPSVNNYVSEKMKMMTATAEKSLSEICS